MYMDFGIWRYMYVGDWDGGIRRWVEGEFRGLYMEQSSARIASRHESRASRCGAPVIGRR